MTTLPAGLQAWLGRRGSPDAVVAVLADSLADPDPGQGAAKAALAALGWPPDEALSALALYRSVVKYGYALEPETLVHLLDLARPQGDDQALARLVAHPFLLAKAGWLYEHAPSFALFGPHTPADRDAFILAFAEDYDGQFFSVTGMGAELPRLARPKQLLATSFWDKDAIDPLALLRKAHAQNLLGVELCIDFHPFNYRRLLPEEIGPEKRAAIRRLVETSGLRLSMHSPIVGPYVPVPAPAKGKQRFFDPMRCLALQKEVVRLAADIGAGSVVFHLIDPQNLAPWKELVEAAAGTPVLVTMENYCHLPAPQRSTEFIRAADAVRQSLSPELAERNFGVTVDFGHLNIEGEDPLIGAARVGRWCRTHRVGIRAHATDNYGDLLYSPPAFSADVHARVSGRGINNGLIVRLLRSMGLRFDVVAEQIDPLHDEDITVLDSAQTAPLADSYEELVDAGRRRMHSRDLGAFLEPPVREEEAYQFAVGLVGLSGLREHMVYRRIQNKKHLSVEEAKRISQDFMKIPQKLKSGLTSYLDDLLLPIQTETGAIQKTQLDLICQNINGALFWTMNIERMSRLFADEAMFRQGEVICSQNTVGSEMFFIKEGEAEVVIDGARVATLGTGEIFGEMSLFYNIERTATIRATSPAVRVGILSRKGLETLFRAQDENARELILRLYKILPERLRNMNEKYKTAINTMQVMIDPARSETGLGGFTVDVPWEEADVLPTLAVDELQQIYTAERAYEPGDVIVREGDEADGAYFLLEGTVRVSVRSPQGEMVEVGTLERGEIFGEMALIDDKPRSATVSCLSACRVGFIGRAEFDCFVQEKSPLAFRLMGFICLGTFRRILRLDAVYSEVKRRVRAGGTAAASPPPADTTRIRVKEESPAEPNPDWEAESVAGHFDIVGSILERRLHQGDLDRILKDLSDTDRNELVDKIGSLLKRVSALVEVSSRMSDTLSLDMLLPRLMDIITEALGADRSTLFLNDPDTDELFSRVAQGGGIGEIRFPNSVGIAGSVFSDGAGEIIHDAYADERFNREVDRRTGYRTRNILCAPVRNKGKIIGVTQVLNKKEGAFDENDMSLLEGLTNQAASALENAQLYEKVERARKEESQLLEVTSAIASELKLDTLLQRVIRATTDMLEADRSTLFMHDAETGTLWSRIAEGLDTKEIRFPATAGIAGSCFTTGAVINIPDAYADARFNPAVDKKTGYRTRNILCMPVVNKNGRKLGVIQVLNKKGGPFGLIDERRLRTFTAQAAIALENAQLFEDVTNERNYNESILKSLSNGVVTLDAARRVIKINAAAARILEWAPAAVNGKPLEEVLTGEANAWVHESLGKVISSGATDLTMDAEVRTADGSPVSANVTVEPLIDVKERAIGYMLILEDITSEKRVRSTMARYMAKEVADKLLEEGEDALGGSAQVATVLFSDIRSFTTISEEIGARETVQLLNEYFTRMIDIIFDNHGILDKYIGDAIMAVFGAPFPTPDDADNAVVVANGMMRALRLYNGEREQAGKRPIHIGIGLSTGELVAGNIGSQKRMDYTVIGDTVNLAARLESACKQYGVPVLLSEFTLRALRRESRWRELDLIRVKGKTRAVGIYEALAHHTPETFPNMADVVRLFADGMQCYRGQEWGAATSRFQDALNLCPGDVPSRLYIERCAYFRDNPPGDDWDGVWTMHEK